MIDREYGKHILSCDTCGEEVEERFDSFQDALDYQKQNGWKSIPCGGGIWQNECPSCQ